MEAMTEILHHRQLTFPGVPVAVPDEVGVLRGLQTFNVIGNNAIPGQLDFTS